MNVLLKTRQQGSTTSLIKICHNENGVLIVSSKTAKEHAQKICEKISSHRARIMTIDEASACGKIPGPIFYDNELVYVLTSHFAVAPSEDLSKKLTTQLNVRLSDDDIRQLKTWNDESFDGEASNAMLARLALRRGLTLK